MIDSAGVSAADDASYVEASVNDHLSLVIGTKLTKHQYLMIRAFVNILIYRLICYYKCILKKKGNLKITVTESSAEVESQDDNTARIFLKILIFPLRLGT